MFAARKLTSALSLLAIAVGTLGVFAVIGVTQGAGSAVAGRFAALQAQLISVSGWNGGPQQNVTSPPSLTAADIAAIERLPHVVAVNTMIGFGGSNIVLAAGDRTWSPGGDGGVEGALPGLAVMGGYVVQAGAFFTEQDVQSLATKAVLGATVASHLFPSGNAVGQQFRVLNVNFLVVGVLAPVGTDNGRDLDNRIYVPVTTLMQKVVGPIKGAKGPPPGAPADFALNFVNLPGLQVMADSVSDVPAVQREITTALEQSHRLAAGTPDDFSVATFTQGEKAATQALGTVQLVSVIVTVVALLLGGFGIVSVLLAAVRQRRREIGLRLAVGAAPADIRRQFMAESVTLTLIGGLAGVLLDAAFRPASALLHLKGVALFLPSPSLGTAALALTATVALGLAFGLYPAHRAARLDPIRTLRSV